MSFAVNISHVKNFCLSTSHLSDIPFPSEPFALQYIFVDLYTAAFINILCTIKLNIAVWNSGFLCCSSNLNTLPVFLDMWVFRRGCLDKATTAGS